MITSEHMNRQKRCILATRIRDLGTDALEAADF